MMPSTSTISVYVSTFLITESRRASGSGTRRQPSLTRPGLRLNPPFTPFFALFPLPRLCVYVCSCACLYVCVPLSLILPSLRLLYSTPRRLNDLHSLPPLWLFFSSNENRNECPLHCSTREHWNRDIFPPERPNHPEFSSSSSFLPKSIYIYLFHRRNCGCEKGKTGTGRPVSNRPLSSIVSILPRIRDISSPRC